MATHKRMISIGIPCFNEELNVAPLYSALKSVASTHRKYNFEYIFVDNGSTDATRTKILEIASKDKKVVGVLLPRNFGPEASGQAALDHTSGDAFIAIAGDFQDPPHLISKFIKKWEEGFNVVFGIYTKSEDNIIITLMRKVFYFVYRKISNIDVPINTTGCSLIDRKVINALKKLPEKYRFVRGLKVWVGFKQGAIYYQKAKRKNGKSSYSIFNYLSHAERGIFGFSYVALDLMVYSGFLITILSFIFIACYLYWVFVFGNPIQASIPLMLAIVFFGGIQLLASSIIGKYIQVIVEETKSRPQYIVDEVINSASKK